LCKKGLKEAKRNVSVACHHVRKDKSEAKRNISLAACCHVRKNKSEAKKDEVEPHQR
jgi:hypothetical protein